MSKHIGYLFFLAGSLFAAKAPRGIINPSFIGENVTHEAPWARMHGAHGTNLGAGMLYYGLVYSSQAKLCVCLGSGDGFVPRVMRQAQRDLGLVDAKTILVDGDTGRWGRPVWLKKGTFLKKKYPDIHLIIGTTKSVAATQAKNWKINYLHIDADRTTEGALQDFLDYLPLMAKNGIITLHDTGRGRPCAKTVEKIRELGHHVINFETLGTGVACIIVK